MDPRDGIVLQTFYSQAEGCVVCALRFSWAATSSNHGLWANMTLSIKPEVDNVSLRRQKKSEPRQ